MRVVLLASGGIDSTTCWWVLRARGWDVFPVFIDYGHPARALEWAAVSAIADVAASRAVRLSVSAELYSDFPPYGLLPARNLLFLTLASAYAAGRNIRAVTVGSTGDDAQRGDGSRRFRAAVERATSVTPPRVRIIAPLSSASKSEVVARAHRLLAPLAATVSCYTDVAGGCRHCRGCDDRARALARAEASS
jgi:7-cyano-7-deazaguanine synthase